MIEGKKNALTHILFKDGSLLIVDPKYRPQEQCGLYIELWELRYNSEVRGVSSSIEIPGKNGLYYFNNLDQKYVESGESEEYIATINLR